MGSAKPTLTPDEKAVMSRIAAGENSLTISLALEIPESTVQRLAKSARDKIVSCTQKQGHTSIPNAARAAKNMGWLD